MAAAKKYEAKAGRKNKSGKLFDEFDCPVCNANNPYSDGFMAGAEIRCFYCGSEFRTSADEEGRLKLREI